MTEFDWHKTEFERLLTAKAALAQGLLFCGPLGTGKLAFARALAQALLCETPVEGGRACGTCSACAWFASGSHPDYRQIEPPAASTAGEAEEVERKSTTIGVDQIRALAAFLNISSHRGGSRVVVIHPAEILNANAANALLKSLEEPPPRTHFLLVTHRPHQVLATIKSRCSQIALRVPETSAAAAWLKSQGVREPAVALAHAGGAPLLALELGAGEYWGTRAAFLRHITARDFDALTAAEAARDYPIPHVVALLQKWSYDLAYCATLGRARYNPDYRDDIVQAASRLDPLATLRFHREMVKLQRIAHHPLNPRLFVEQLLLAYRDLSQVRVAAA